MNTGSDCEPSTAKKTSMDTAVELDLSQLDDIFPLKEGQRTALKAFSRWTTLVCFTFDWLLQEFS